MNRIFSMLLAVVFATTMLAQSGLTCEDPIPVGKDYKGTIDGPCELWYTANTYDLPLHVYFTPVVDNSTWGPEVEIDFTCVPGVYTDQKLDSLINLVSDFDITFPIELLSELVVRNGKNEWDLQVAKSYREQLADFGITYPLQAVVKVRFYEAGTISLTPDTAFSSCMDNADYVNLGDTLTVEANEPDRVFVFPYTEWQEDSIRFVWTGSAPAQVYVAVQECSFAPSISDPYVFSSFELNQDAPYKLYSEDMKALIKEQKEGGIYYAKIVASGKGELVVEKIPLSAATDGAITLEHGTEVAIENDALYCFPKTWTATQMIASTNRPITMYISNTDEFEKSSADARVLATSLSVLENDSHQAIYLSDQELSNLAKQATEDFLYVRFSCPASTKVSIDEWFASECSNKSYMIYPNVPQFIASKSRSVIYRLRYADFVGYDITIKWDGASTLPTYISEICNYTPSTNNAALLLKPAPSIKAGSTYVIEASTIAEWASRVDEEGYIYARFNPNFAGNVTFISDKPITTPDPVYTTIDEVVCDGGTYTWNGTTYDATGTYTQTLVAANGADSIVTLNLTVRPANVPTTEKVSVRYDEPYTWNGTTYTESGSYTVTLQDAYGCDSVVTLELTVLEKSDVKPVDNLVLNLASAFKVYSMDHLAWVAQDVTLNWGGSTPLYVFIAKSKDFALTPYNRYVIHYEEIVAGGSWVLTKEQMASWAAHADADGQIYVRFLTEFEGELIVK